MKKLSISALVTNSILAIAVLFAVSQFTPIPVLATAFVVTISGAAIQYFAPMPKALFMGMQVEIWQDSVEKMLLEDNTWLNGISNVDDDNIINGKIVHIPQAGNPSQVKKNRTTLPATIQRRTDSEVLYMIDEYTTDPILIVNVEKVELSYDKIKSVLEQDIDNLTEEIAEGMLTNIVISPIGSNNMLPISSILQTNSDKVVPSSLAGSTGNRKAYSLGDLQRAQSFFRTQKSWKEGNMNVLLTPEAAVQMFPAESNITATYMAAVTEAERRLGVVYKCQGFNIYIRSQVYSLATDNSFKASGAVPAATDSEGILFWNKSMVEKALGDITMFDDEGNPVYYGDIYSLLVRMGGRARRADFAGLLVMKQAASA